MKESALEPKMTNRFLIKIVSEDTITLKEHYIKGITHPIINFYKDILGRKKYDVSDVRITLYDVLDVDLYNTIVNNHINPDIYIHYLDAKGQYMSIMKLRDCVLKKVSFSPLDYTNDEICVIDFIFSAKKFDIDYI